MEVTRVQMNCEGGSMPHTPSHGSRRPTLKFEQLECRNMPSAVLATGAGPGGGPHVRVLDAAGIEVAGFFAYQPNFTGGVRVATGDITGDGVEDLVTAPGPGGG